MELIKFTPLPVSDQRYLVDDFERKMEVLEQGALFADRTTGVDEVLLAAININWLVLPALGTTSFHTGGG